MLYYVIMLYIVYNKYIYIYTYPPTRRPIAWGGGASSYPGFVATLIIFPGKNPQQKRLVINDRVKVGCKPVFCWCSPVVSMWQSNRPIPMMLSALWWGVFLFILWRSLPLHFKIPLRFGFREPKVSYFFDKQSWHNKLLVEPQVN